MNKETTTEKFGKKRELTDFIFEQLIYDHIAESLDSNREEAFKKYLKTNPEAVGKLESLKESIKYCKQLDDIKVSETFISEVSQDKSALSLFFDKANWNDWPENIKWAFQAFIVSISVSMFAFFLPWDDVFNWLNWGDDAFTIAKIEKQKEEVPVDTNSDALKPENNPQVVAVENIAKDTVAEEVKKKVAAAPKAKEKPKPMGMLYRANMRFDGLSVRAPELASYINELGGKKAGKVALGWKKPKGRYFHFSLPESNYKMLLERLKSLGKVRIFKSAHPRVMPDGVLRIILWIEGNEVGAEPPPVEASTNKPEQEQPTNDEAAKAQ